MTASRVRIRRGRRTDFTAVMHLLATSGVAVPPPDRATLRRFRNLVADLGVDFYCALVDGTLAGFVHVTYARQLTVPPGARLDQLLVAAPFRRQGIGAALLAFAQSRARQRGCGTFSYVVPTNASPAKPFLEKAGLHRRGEWFAQQLAAPDD
jgi:GNAT superfamily N-acetyltransferase